MDPGKSVEDQFLKLHPLWPVSTRIGIVGAGPSGLSAAYALTKLGYTNVTVLEKYQTVGGMCESADIEGKVYDLGGQVLAANSAPCIFHLAKETGSELEEMDSHKFAMIDSSNGHFKDMKVVDDYVSVISLTLKLQDEAKNSGRSGVHAVSGLASDLSPEFLQNHGFKSVPKSVAYGYTASGYGFVQDMPYAYIHEFTKTSIAGKLRRFKGGYMSFWQKISQSLPIHTQCNTEVLSIRRDSFSISVGVRNKNREIEKMEFDKLIISGSFPFKKGKTYRSPISSSAGDSVSTDEILDMSELEKDLFEKVQTIDYYTTVLKIKGLEHIPMGFYYFGEFMDDPATIGHPVAMQKFYEDTDIFLFWSYGNSFDITGEIVTERAKIAAKSMGGEVQKLILQRRFKYFPHVNSQDIKNGFFDRLENELQGQSNTYYVGGLMAFELTERNASYAMSLVCKHFANVTAPSFPYVKRLLPLQSDVGTRYSNKSSALHALDFPSLPTLDAYLRHWGTHDVTQNKQLYTWINEKGDTVSQRTYGELHANASHIAKNLLTSTKQVIKPGERVLLVHVPGLDFIDAFFGCLRARVVPVPVLPPDPFQNSTQTLLHIQNIVNSCNAVAILSSFSYHTSVQACSIKNKIFLAGKNRNKTFPQWPDLPWLHTDSWTKNSFLSEDDQSEPFPDELCFLQYTSGSTGDAKGVMITQKGVTHNVKLMRKRYKSTSDTVSVSWLPQYHDMGLIGGLFTTMVSGGSGILFSPLTFIKNPLIWLEAMSKYRATHSAAPNFAFELLVRRLESEKLNKYDLNSLVFLMVAAEPVRPKTLERFLELTKAFGLSQEVIAPGYGLAENCVYASCAFGQGYPIVIDWENRVCCGYTEKDDPDVDIRIVDPETCIEHENSDREGEIWISSPSAGIGYWGDDDLSKKTFKNELHGQLGKNFTRTGDLGRIIDGRLFITGRIKDLIIVNGRNIYSSDVEKTVESSSEILRPGGCAVIGVPEEVLSEKGISTPESSDQVGLVVIAEVREIKSVSFEVIKQIHNCVAEEHGITIASIVLVKPRTISKTTSGKIKRFECLKQFTDGTLNSIDMKLTCQERKGSHAQVKNPLSTNPIIDKTEIIQFLRELLSEQTGISIVSISVTESLMSYGVDSIGVVRAARKLSDFLGVPIGAIDIFTATCIDDLASFAENLLQKARPQLLKSSFDFEETMTANFGIVEEVTSSHKMGIWIYQLLAILYVSTILIFPAYFSIQTFTSLISTPYILSTPWFNYLVCLIYAPLAWLLCIFSTCFCIAFFGKFMQPNHALAPHISIWSMDFVKWWALFKVQNMSSSVLAVHLRGTVFLKYWFIMFGAKIGSSVVLDTVDITDPSLLSIGDGVVLAEGVLVQSHEVKNGTVSFATIRICRNASVGPYAVIQKGSLVGEESHVPALQLCNADKTIFDKVKLVPTETKNHQRYDPLYHFFGIYMVGFISSLSAAATYFIFLWAFNIPPSIQHYAFVCICGTFHWLPFTVIAYTTMLPNTSITAITFAICIAFAYLTHGIILIFITSIFTRFIVENQSAKKTQYKTWFQNRLITACHVRFAKYISGTEAFCMYLRLLGAKIGQHCSIRAINPVSNPELISIGDGVHLGDYSRIISGFYSFSGYTKGGIKVHDNSVLGSHSLILPGSVIQKNVILGALSLAPMNSVLQLGGVYVGSQTPIMVKNTIHALDERLGEMDIKYKKILGGLAANFATATLKVKSRYFHRIGAAGKGSLRIYNEISGLPDHKIFRPGKNYSIIIRHSNCLSNDDDARSDPRGAAIKILSDENCLNSSILDLTLKTGKAFHAGNIADFATWLVCGVAAREEHVKREPHIREAMWDSLRKPDSYAELHYYSNISRLFRFKDGQEMYVKFKLQPYNETISEDSGTVEPVGILPPETGAIPRDEKDTRPLLFLDEDFKKRVNSPGGVHYVLQLQIRPVPQDKKIQNIALDCTKPWNETEFPYINVGEITIDQTLSKDESEELEFNPYLKCHEVDVIPATSCTQSASMDHGRSIIYEICQHLRNRKPLPESWRIFLEQTDIKVDLSGCPMAAATTLVKKDADKVTLTRTRHQTLWVTCAQPLLQIIVPYFLMGLVIFPPLKWVLYMKEIEIFHLHWLLVLFWLSSGVLAAIACVVAKWILVGKKKEGETVHIWSKGIFMDTIWQAIRTLVGEYLMEMVSGSAFFGLWMKLMGSKICWDQGVYVDSMGAILNPDMVAVEKGGCVGRDALLFGHIYEGEGGKVKYGKIRIGEGGFVGTKAVVMPGVVVENAGCLGALSLAMKGETIRSR